MASLSASAGAVKRSRHAESNSLVERVTRSNFLLSLVCAFPGLIVTLILQLLSSSYNPISIPLFDASPTLLYISSSPFVRWDAVHFLSVAAQGYRYEQQLAFQPGWHATLWLVGRGWQAVFGGELECAIARGSIPFMILFAGVRGRLFFRSAVSCGDDR